MSETRQLFKMEDLRGRLSEKHYKLTPQRKEILQIFIDCEYGEHLSAEEVYALLKEKNFDFGLATVYRSVELLQKLGILNKIDFGDGRTRYELSAANPELHQHHHLICLHFIEKKSGFQIVNHEVKFFGYCSECKDKVRK